MKAKLSERGVADTGGRLVMLDVIKAVCIIMVIITHTPLTSAVKSVILYPFTILPAVPMFVICSVFVFCYVEDRKGGTVWSWFSTRVFWRRLNRFLLPYAVAIVIIIAGLVFVMDARRLPAAALFQMIQQGGRGPGAYYVIVTFQLLLLFPFLREAFNKKPAVTVVGLVLTQIAYETLCRYVWGMSSGVYNCLIFRFLTHMALGFLLYRYSERLKGLALPAACIVLGAVYLINIYYLDYKPVLGNGSFTQSAIPALYAFGVLCYILRLEPLARKWEKSLRPLCYIGKSSFHILLTQMVLFYFMRVADFEAQTLKSLPLIVLFDVVVSVCAGCLFSFIDDKLRGALKSRRSRSAAV